MTSRRNSSCHTMRIGPVCSTYPLSVEMMVVPSLGFSVTVAVSLKCSIVRDESAGSFAAAALMPKAVTMNEASAALRSKAMFGFVATAESGGLETKAFRIIYDPDQLVASAAELVAAGEDQTAFAAIKNFDSLRVRTKIKRNPPLPGRVVILVVAAADEGGNFTKGHADLQFDELAVLGG